MFDEVFWYFPSRIVLTKCVENFSKCNLKIFYGIKIEKMEAKVLFEVKAVGRDLGMVKLFIKNSKMASFLTYLLREKS